MATSTDEAFWPPIGSIFDLTLKFEEIIFSIAFSSAAVALFLFLFRHYCQQPVCARNGMLLWAKLVSISTVTHSQHFINVWLRPRPASFLLRRWLR